MKLRDSIVKFDEGVRKVIPPEETIDKVLAKLHKMGKAILKRYQREVSPEGIFLYECRGTNLFENIVRRPGSSGKGHSDRLALASALMEMVERYSCYKYLQNKRNQKLISFKELQNNKFNIDDIFSNIINKDYAKGINKKEILNLRLGFRRAWTIENEIAFLPFNFIFHSLEVTNGMSAGNSYEEALLHGIYEIIERHCKHLILNQNMNTPTINFGNINSSIIMNIIKRFNMLNQYFLIKDFSLGIGIPVIGLIRRLDNGKHILTAGCASNPEEALIRALAESIQLEQHPANYLRSHQVKFFCSSKNIIDFQNLPNIEKINLKLELKNVNDLLKKKRMKIFYCETTDKELDIPCLMVYVSRTKFPLKENFDSNLLSGIIYEYFRLRNYGKAKYYINKAKKNNRPQWLLYNGMCYIINKDYREAIKCFNEILVYDAAEKFIKFGLFYIGLSYLALKKEDRTIEIFKNLLKCHEFFCGGYKYAELKTEFSEIVGDIDLLSRASNLYEKLHPQYEILRNLQALLLKK